MRENPIARYHAEIAQKLGYQVRQKAVETRAGLTEVWDYLDPDISIEKHYIAVTGANGQIVAKKKLVERANKWKMIPAYTTNMCDAWKLVEYMRDKMGLQITLHVAENGCEVRVVPGLHNTTFEESPEKAICALFMQIA
jgi:hypothetical protein